MNNIKNLAIRHGEAMLVPVEKLPRGKMVEKTSFIVAHSETGHHHVLEAEEPFTVNEKKMYLELLAPARLVHKKTIDAHKTLTVPAGKYKIVQKTEYNPWLKVTQRVFD